MMHLMAARAAHCILIFLILTLGACTDKKSFENFDAASWKEDKNGCKGTRKQLADNFEQIRRDLLGMSQEEVLELLGRPDFQLLMERTQKAYVYFIEPGVQCQGQNQKETSKARTVSFRFSAVNRATEIVYGEGKIF